MKKVLSFLAVVFAVVMLAACGKKHDVTFDLDYEGAPAASVVSVKNKAKVAKPEDPAREGYEFNAWQLDGADYNFDAKVTKALTLKAKWDRAFEVANFEFVVNVPEGTEADELYIVGNFSDWEFKEEYKLAKGDDGKFTVEFELDASLSELQYKIAADASWNFVEKAADGAELDNRVLNVEPNNVVEITVALWANGGPGVVEVALDLGYEGAPEVDALEVQKGSKVVLPDDPEREGYVFLGWFLGEEEFDAEEAEEVFEEFALVARWIQRHTVEFDLDYDEKVEYRQANDGAKVSAPADPERLGHDFLGWFLGNELYDFDAAVEGPLKLVAKWEEHEKIEVTFDLDLDGEENDVVEIYVNTKVAKPADPVRVGYFFKGWNLGAAAFDFDEALKEVDVTLVAQWEKADPVTVSYETRLEGVAVPSVETEVYDDVKAPELGENFVKDGYRFAGWYLSKKGAFWNEPDAQAFPLNPDKDVKLYAYWEPVNSVAMRYEDDLTYTSTMTAESRLILNPLEYQWSHETDMIDMLVAPLYSTEVDWDKAIEDGLADFHGDFSKFEEKLFSIEALDYHYVLIGGAKYPVNEEGESAVVDGKFDRDLARSIRGTEWTYEIRKDMVFDDGTPIDAWTFDFTLRNWLDPVQNNFRANMWYKNEDNANGRPLVNTFEYYMGQVPWHQVGFEVDDQDNYKFTIKTTEPVTLQYAVGMGNDIRLINPNKYLNSIDVASGKSKYGTVEYPFSSYGSYVISQWDEGSRIVFNKNYDYVGKHLINYKSQRIRIVKDVHESYNLFKAGQTSVLGLTKDYYAEYAEDPNVKDSWNNFPQYMIINQSNSKLTGGNVHPTIMGDMKFRQALLHGLDRKYFAYTVYAPNKPTLMPIPNNAKNYLYDPIYYTESPQHIALIEEELGWDLEDYGYSPARAVALFDEAYADWLAEGNTGPVTLKYVTDDSEFSESLDNYIKESYEELFEDAQGNKRLIIDINVLAATAREHAIQNHDFDLVLTALGFGSALDANWQYLAIGLLPGDIGASGFGLFYPYIGGPKEYEMAEYLEWEIEVDFANAYAHLSAQDPEDLLDGYADFLAMLDEEGVYKGTVEDLAVYLVFASENPFDGGPTEPFPGASHDLHNATAAFERVFLKYVPVIPTVTRAGSTIYADNVVIEWPEYSEAFGWGAARYRYLNTDPDFAE